MPIFKAHLMASGIIWGQRCLVVTVDLEVTVRGS